MSEKKIVSPDPEAGTFWRHLPSSELYRVRLIAANPNSGERVVVYFQPASASVYYQRPITEFRKKFTREKQL